MRFNIFPKPASVLVLTVSVESTSPWSARPEPGTWALYPSSSQALNCRLPTSTYFLSNIVLLFLHTIHIEYVCILNYILNMLIFKNIFEGTSLAVQRLRLCASNTGAMGSIPGRGTKIPHAAWPGQENIQINKK